MDRDDHINEDGTAFNGNYYALIPSGLLLVSIGAASIYYAFWVFFWAASLMMGWW